MICFQTRFWLILLTAIALAAEVSAASNAPPVGYKKLRLKVTLKEASKLRTINCLEPKKGVTLCFATPDRKAHEAKVVAWFFKNRLAKLDVNFEDGWQASHAKFAKPYIVEFGPPDVNDLMLIPFGPYEGATLTTTVWQKVRGGMASIQSKKPDPYGSKSYSFSLMFVDLARTKQVMAGMMAYETAGVTY